MIDTFIDRQIGRIPAAPTLKRVIVSPAVHPRFTRDICNWATQRETDRETDRQTERQRDS